MLARVPVTVLFVAARHDARGVREPRHRRRRRPSPAGRWPCAMRGSGPRTKAGSVPRTSRSPTAPPTDDALVGVSAPDLATSVSLHETTTGDDGMTGMHHTPSIAIPAGGTVTLEPGGYHVMLEGLQRRPRRGRDRPARAHVRAGRAGHRRRAGAGRVAAMSDRPAAPAARAARPSRRARRWRAARRVRRGRDRAARARPGRPGARRRGGSPARPRATSARVVPQAAPGLELVDQRGEPFALTVARRSPGARVLRLHALPGCLSRDRRRAQPGARRRGTRRARRCSSRSIPTATARPRWPPISGTSPRRTPACPARPRRSPARRRHGA